MSRFDINQISDFNRLTVNTGAQAQNIIAGVNPTLWDIQEASFRGVLFHVITSKSTYQGAVATIQDTGGRRKVKYQFPYKDGQTTDDLGRKPSSFDFDVLIHGIRYLQGLNTLLQALNDPTPGVLVHPVRGEITCVVEDFTVVHTNEKRKAAQIRIVFTEHNFTIGDIKKAVDNSVNGALSKALATFADIDKGITAVAQAENFKASVKAFLTQALTNYKGTFASTLTQLNITFNIGSSRSFPSLLPVNKGGTGNPGTGANFPISTSPSDPFANVPPGISSTTATALAVKSMTDLVNAARAQLAQLILSLQNAANGAGAFEFHDNIVDMKNSGILMQDVFEKGVASSRAQIVDFTTTKVMSIREVAFAVGGLQLMSRISDIDLLNPELESVNMIPVGTQIRVPIS